VAWFLIRKSVHARAEAGAGVVVSRSRSSAKDGIAAAGDDGEEYDTEEALIQARALADVTVMWENHGGWDSQGATSVCVAGLFVKKVD
jgi:hypothetical protein